MPPLADGILANQRYRVVRRLGSGGMGQVYLVEDTLADDRSLALKTVESSQVQPESLEAFRREFAGMVPLRHPNLARVYDFGEVSGEGVPFFTMEYVDGGDLVTAVADLPLAGLCDRLAQVCRALEYLHGRGYLHRDLKPANILVTEREGGGAGVKLVDFGLMAGAPGRGEESGIVGGTPEYLAPEVFRGEPAGTASDLYALGVVMYELVCGRVPFTGDVLDSVGRQHLEATPERLPGPDSAVAEALWPIIEKLLAKAPTERYASGVQVIEAMNQCAGLRLPLETSESTEAYFVRSPLVGRASELGRLKDAVSALRDSRPGRRPLLLEARAGLGKTRLLEQLRGYCQLRGVPTFDAVCPRVAGPPYGPIRGILCQALAEAGVALIERPGDFDVVLAAAAKVARMRMPVKHAGLDAARVNAQSADVVLRFLLRLGRKRPFVVVLDDAQWIDSASADMILYVARNAGAAPFVLVVAYRDDELGEGAARGLVDELAESGAARVRPRPLSPADVEGMLSGMLGELRMPEGFLSALCRDSGGNPFFAGELLRMYAQEGFIVREGDTWRVRDAVLSQTAEAPSSLRDLATRRFRVLPDELGRVVRLLAVVGEPAASGLLARVLSVPPDRLQLWLDPLLSRGVVEREKETGRVRLTHPELGHALYAAMPAAARREQHLLVGEALEGMGEGQDTEALGPLARHFLDAGDVSRGRTYGLASAQAFRHAHANAEALRLYDRVLALEPHPDPMWEVEISEGLADACRFLGDTGRAVVWCRRGVAASRALSRRDAELRLHVTMGRVLEGMGDFRESQRHYDSAVGLVEAVSPAARELAGLHDGMAQLALRKGEADLALTLGRQAMVVLGDDLQNAAAASVYTNMAIAHQRLDQSEEALSCFEESMSIRERIGDREGLSRSLNNKGMLHRSRGETDQALTCYQQSLRIKVSLGNRQGAATTHYNIGNVHAQIGEFARARAEYERSLELRRKIGDRPGVANSLLGVAFACRKTGNYDGACSGLEQAIDLQKELGAESAFAYLELAGTLAEIGAYEEAEAVLERASALPTSALRTGDVGRHRILQAEVAAGRQSWAAASDALAAAVGLFEEKDDTDGLLDATMLAAEIALGRDEVAEAERLVEQAGEMEGVETGEAAACRLLCLKAELARKRGETSAALQFYEGAASRAEAFGVPALRWRSALGAAEMYRAKDRYVSELRACERLLETIGQVCRHIVDPARRAQYLASGGRERIVPFLHSLPGRLGDVV